MYLRYPQIAVAEGGPRPGHLDASTVASLTSTGYSNVSGGLACIARAALQARLLPSFRHYPALNRKSPG